MKPKYQELIKAMLHTKSIKNVSFLDNNNNPLPPKSTSRSNRRSNKKSNSIKNYLTPTKKKKSVTPGTGTVSLSARLYKDQK